MPLTILKNTTNLRLVSNKKLFYVMSALAIAIAIPLTIRSVNQQTETQSRAAEPAVQTQTNELGTVTVKSGSNLSQIASTPDSGGQKEYFLSVIYSKGNSCWTSGFSYRVNGLRFNYKQGRSEERR